MNGIKFNTRHSYSSFGFILTDVKISAPEVYTKYVEIPGMNKVLDLSDVFGAPQYKMRSGSFEFVLVPNETAVEQRITEFTNYVHGQSMKLTLDDDPNYYYEARCFVDGYTKNGELVKLSLKADIQPYKLKVEKTVKNQTLTAGTTTGIMCKIGRMTTIPTITVSGYNDITVEDVVVSPGTTVLDWVPLKQGSNAINITVSTTTNITLEYQEGDL